MSHTERAREHFTAARKLLEPLAYAIGSEGWANHPAVASVAALLAYVCAMDFIGEIASAAPGMTEAELGLSMARIMRQVEWARAALAAAPTEAPAPAEAPAVAAAWMVEDQDPNGPRDHIITQDREDAAQLETVEAPAKPLYTAAALSAARESGRREGRREMRHEAAMEAWMLAQKFAADPDDDGVEHWLREAEAAIRALP